MCWELLNVQYMYSVTDFFKHYNHENNSNNYKSIVTQSALKWRVSDVKTAPEITSWLKWNKVESKVEQIKATKFVAKLKI